MLLKQELSPSKFNRIIIQRKLDGQFWVEIKFKDIEGNMRVVEFSAKNMEDIIYYVNDGSRVIIETCED